MLNEYLLNRYSKRKPTLLRWLSYPKLPDLHGCLQSLIVKEYAVPSCHGTS